MPSFHSYIIHHLQLDSIQQFTPAKENQYIVIWFEKIPLGHVWLELNKLLQHETFLSYIQKAIYPAVEYYMHYSANTEWKNFLAENNFIQLSAALNEAVHQFKTKLNQNNIEKVSVVICTRNRSQALQQCLKSLIEINDENSEIIVVDNASDNNETKIVAQQFSNVKYIYEERKGLDIARNTGAKHAAYNLIAYTDDDVKIPVNWISNIRTCFNDPLTMAVTGLVIPTEINTQSQFIFEKEWSFNKGFLPVAFDHAYFLKHKKEGVPVWDIGAGANMAFRREAFNIAGLFDERLDVGAAGCSGDSEMWYRILAEGWNCNYFPHLYVFHQHRKTLKELRIQLFNYMKGHVCALLVQHEKYHHTGNLNRIKKDLPSYYFKRIKNHITKFLKGEFSSLFTEIKGSIAGWKYYKKHENFIQQPYLRFPDKLYTEVIIKKNTLVSVIIPCYNQAHYLKEAIDSVLNQTYKNIEVIVVNDGSKDHTAKICAAYKNNVRCIGVERVGLPAARNIGVQFSKGDFIVFLDADDFLYPGAIELNLYFFSLNKKAAFISGAYDKIDNDGNYLNAITAKSKKDLNYLSLLQGNYIAMEAVVMYRRDLFFYFHFDTRLQSCEDYDLNLKISRRLPVFHHEKKIAVYRMHTNNMSKNKQLMLENALLVLKRQQPFLKTIEERDAFEQGLENWRTYYEA
jgi:glycosyltransferase involved in cell wall biosynthesis